jgi:hypothetical protein
MYRSVRLTSSLAVALLDGLSEQPAGYSASISHFRLHVISGVAISFVNKLFALSETSRLRWIVLSELSHSATVISEPSVEFFPTRNEKLHWRRCEVLSFQQLQLWQRGLYG